MKLNEFLAMMESVAPKSLAYDGDNVGLLVGTDKTEIHKVAVALDCTVEVANEATRLGCDLVLTHHPLFFNPVQYFRPDMPATAAAYILARNGIGMFAAHTNLDAAKGGVNDVLAELIGLTNVDKLSPENLGRMGEFEDEMKLSELIALCEDRLHSKARFCGDLNAVIKTAAVIGGSGGGDLWEAYKSQVDAFITGEVKYSQGLDADTLGMNVIVLGHYETESIVLKPLIARLQKLSDDVQYNVIYPKQHSLSCFGRG